MIKKTVLIPLKQEFFNRKTVTVARELLGKILVKNYNNSILTGRIVETEAYLGDSDPACHAYGKITKRNEVLFEKPGTIYVYFIYGNYFCFNVVTEQEGVGSAVLIRAVEPIQGIDTFKKRRNFLKDIYNLTNGPAKLSMAFGFNLKDNRKDITGGEIFIAADSTKVKFEIEISERIGLNKGTEFPYRFFIKGNRFVTKHKFNK